MTASNHPPSSLPINTANQGRAPLPREDRSHAIAPEHRACHCRDCTLPLRHHHRARHCCCVTAGTKAQKIKITHQRQTTKKKGPLPTTRRRTPACHCLRPSTITRRVQSYVVRRLINCTARYRASILPPAATTTSTHHTHSIAARSEHQPCRCQATLPSQGLSSRETLRHHRV